MAKFLVAQLLLCAALCGCGNQSPPISSPWQNQNLEILAAVVTRPLDSSIKLSINGEPVINGTTEVGAGSAQNFMGNWRGNRVLARFSRQQSVFSSASRIDVFINGNLVETVRL